MWAFAVLCGVQIGARAQLVARLRLGEQLEVVEARGPAACAPKPVGDIVVSVGGGGFLGGPGSIRCTACSV